MVMRVVRQVGIADPLDVRIVFEESGHLQRALAVALHPDVQALETEIEVEGVLRALDGAEIPHQLRGRLGDVGKFAELFGEGDAVV